MADMKRIKAGVIGTGFIGPAHIEALRRLGYIDVVALAECSDDVAKSKAEMLGIDRYYDDYKQLLKDGKIQSVHICSPNYLHYEMAKGVLEAWLRRRSLLSWQIRKALSMRSTSTSGITR
jgi:predicted dehydrogenase